MWTYALLGGSSGEGGPRQTIERPLMVAFFASPSRQTDVTLRWSRPPFILCSRAASTTTSRIAGMSLYCRDGWDSHLPSADLEVKLYSRIPIVADESYYLRFWRRFIKDATPWARDNIVWGLIVLVLPPLFVYFRNRHAQIDWTVTKSTIWLYLIFLFGLYHRSLFQNSCEARC